MHFLECPIVTKMVTFCCAPKMSLHPPPVVPSRDKVILGSQKMANTWGNSSWESIMQRLAFLEKIQNVLHPCVTQ